MVTFCGLIKDYRNLLPIISVTASGFKWTVPPSCADRQEELFVVVLNPRSHLNSRWILLVTLLASKLPSCQYVNGQRTHLSRDRYLQLINNCLFKYSRPRWDTSTKLLWVHQQGRLNCQVATIAKSLINPTWCINMS